MRSFALPILVLTTVIALPNALPSAALTLSLYTSPNCPLRATISPSTLALDVGKCYNLGAAKSMHVINATSGVRDTNGKYGREGGAGQIDVDIQIVHLFQYTPRCLGSSPPVPMLDGRCVGLGGEDNVVMVVV